MMLDLFGSRRLLLAGASLGWLWVAAGGVALVLLLALYREERRLVSRRTGLVLLGLRLTAAAVLVAALFEPIAARSYREAVKGRVIVAVDVSESMATADPGRSVEDQQRLAKALRLSPGEAVKELSRREISRRLLSTKGSAIETIARTHPVEAVTFARATAPATLAGLAETLKQPGKPDDPGTLTTDWQPVLAEAVRDGDSPVLGVVLLTDGRQNAPGDDSAATLDRLASRGIPVYPILIGSTIPPRDAAIAAVRAPKGVYKGDVARIEATLKLDGYAGREVVVTLERPGAAPVERRVRAPAETHGPGVRPVVSFPVPTTEAGTVPLTIALQPLDGDVRPDNDRRTVSVQVADDKAAVLLVDGEARWEFRYLRNALTRDPQVKLEAVVFHQPETTGVSTQASYGTTLPPRPETEPEAESEPAPNRDPDDPLGAFDVIVLGDVEPADFPPEAWTRLESYVAERGGTLILSPGPRFWHALASNETARKLMPVLDPRPGTLETSQGNPAAPTLLPGAAVLPTLAATADATAWPMLQFASDPEQSRLIWAGLPRLPWTLAGKPKPGATALAQIDADADATATAPAGSGTPAAVIAAQAYGLGKVLWVGTNGTWRWRYRVGDAYHHRFWGQAVRWGAADKLAGGNAFVRFGPVRPQVAEGEEVRLQARIAEGVAGVGPNLLIAARVFKAETTSNEATGEAVAVVPLRPVAGQPRAYDGTTPALPLGRYVIRLDVPELAASLHLDDRGPATPQALLEVVARETSERIELAVDREPAARLAAATGGHSFADHEADALPPLLRSRTSQAVRTEETPLWDHPAALLLFFAIVTSEWVLRKQAGLP